MIYDVVMFFVEKGSADQGVRRLGARLGRVDRRRRRRCGRRHIEKTLAKMLPLLLGFLASLLGLGGISEKIKEILETVQKPVMSVVDKLVAGAVKFGKKLLTGAKNLGKKALGKARVSARRRIRAGEREGPGAGSG